MEKMDFLAANYVRMVGLCGYVTKSPGAASDGGTQSDFYDCLV